MKAELITYEKDLADAKKANQDLSVSVETSQQRLSELKDRFNQVQAQLQAAQNEAAQLTRQVKALDYEQQQRAQADDSYEQQVARNERAKTENEAKLTAYQEQMAQVQQQQNDYDAYQKEQVSQLQTQREQLITLQERCKQTQRQVSDCEAQLTAQTNAKTTAQASLEEIQTNLASQQLSVQERGTILKRAQAEQANVLQQQTACDHELGALNDQVEALSDQQVRTQQLAAAATDDYRRLELSQTKLTGEVDHATADLAEKYSLTVTAASSDVSELELPAITEQFKLLKRGLD